ncbi:hypothetical protein G7046_g3393 [Stylonectria norvegica]|nr:hypothetical protein G7046_g3393 [Stylonectria norvegica]
MGLLPLTYTRPKYVDSIRSSSSSFSENEKSDGSVKSGRSNSSSGIPESLAFDKIINGGTCPPLTVRDFMSYLIYIEHAAENLQFYLWCKDYEKRFHLAKTTDLKLAPEWTPTMQEEAMFKIRREQAGLVRGDMKGIEIFKGTDFEKQGRKTSTIEATNPFHTPPRTPNSKSSDGSIYAASNTQSLKLQASSAFEAAGVRQPFTIQPFREEVNRVIATYISDGAPRQLNLSSNEQKTAIQALAYTTHPTAFRNIFRSVEESLRHQAHPNFVRWSICNGNPARVLFARCLGVGLIIAGFVIGLIVTLSKAPRGYRALSAIAFALGISTLVAAYKGMCVVLHGMHHRHVRPWELFVDNDNGDELEKRSFDSFGSTNSYEDEPWVVKYERRNVIRKVFDRELWIQEPALRQIQDTIFIQAVLSSLLLAAVLTAIFVAVPGGNLF